MAQRACRYWENPQGPGEPSMTPAPRTGDEELLPPTTGSSAIRGDSRIFSIHLPDRTLARAGEITRGVDPRSLQKQGNEWRGGEVEVTEERISWYSTKMAIEEIAGRYTRAERPP